MSKNSKNRRGKILYSDVPEIENSLKTAISNAVSGFIFFCVVLAALFRLALEILL